MFGKNLKVEFWKQSFGTRVLEEKIQELQLQLNFKTNLKELFNYMFPDIFENLVSTYLFWYLIPTSHVYMESTIIHTKA